MPRRAPARVERSLDTAHALRRQRAQLLILTPDEDQFRIAGMAMTYSSVVRLLYVALSAILVVAQVRR